MLTTCIFACGLAAGWLLRAAKAKAAICRYVGPRQSVTRGKTGPDPEDIPAICRYVGPRQSVTRGKTGPDPEDIPAICRYVGPRQSVTRGKTGPDPEDRMWDGLGLYAAQSDHWGQDDGDDVADQEVDND